MGGIDPEQVIVFETIGSISAFQNVVKRITGMEWLGDFDTNIAEPEPGFMADGASSTSVAGRLFVVVGNRTAYAKSRDCGIYGGAQLTKNFLDHLEG